LEESDVGVTIVCKFGEGIHRGSGGTCRDEGALRRKFVRGWERGRVSGRRQVRRIVCVCLFVFVGWVQRGTGV